MMNGRPRLMDNYLDYYEAILKAMEELGGRVSSKNQLFEYVRDKYRLKSRKTFYKRLSELIEQGLITCKQEPSSAKHSGLECQLEYKYQALKILEESRKAFPGMMDIIEEEIEKHSIQVSPDFVAMTFVTFLSYLVMHHVGMLYVASEAKIDRILRYLMAKRIEEEVRKFIGFLPEPQGSPEKWGTELKRMADFVRGVYKIWAKSCSCGKKIEKIVKRMPLDFYAECWKQGKGKIEFKTQMYGIQALCQRME